MSDGGTTDPASGIIEAVARLRAAFLNAGLREPVAIVLAGEEQALRLSLVFAQHLGRMPQPCTETARDGATVLGMKVVCDVAAEPPTTDDYWSRDRVIKLLKHYAGGGDCSGLFLRQVCREAFKLLHRQRGAENVHFSPKGESDAG